MVRKSKKLPRHLIVYRTSAMGDVAMLAHALRALKRAYPDLQVTVATRPLFRAFFTGLDVGFLDVDVKGAHHSLCGIWRLAAQARRLGADAVADVHGVLRSVTFRTALRLHGIPFAAIEKGRDEKGEFIRRGGRGVNPAKHTVVRYCDVFRKLGFVFDDPKPAVRREHPSPMGKKTGTWIGFAPFSAQQGKTYPEPLARETVRLLAGRYDRVFIHSGGGVEAEFAQEMERLYPNVTALFGRVKMAGEIDLIANLDCVGMGSDASRSGILRLRLRSARHRAGRYGVPPVLGLRKQTVPLRRLPLSACRDARHDRGAGRGDRRQMTIGLNMKSPGISGAFFVSGRVPRRNRRALSCGRVFYRLFGPAVFPAFETGCSDRFGSFWLCPVCVSGAAFPVGTVVSRRYLLRRITMQLGTPRSPSWSKRLLS